ncbi:MAG: hypothetical protein RRB13_11300 [bacterium]|nr:hypothetical protein [bacterium]
MKLVPQQYKIPFIHRPDYSIQPLEEALGKLMDRLVPFEFTEGDPAPSSLFLYPFDFKLVLKYIEQFPQTRLLSASKRLPRLGALPQKTQNEINAKVAHFRLVDQSSQLRHFLVALLERDFAWEQCQLNRKEMDAGKEGISLTNLDLKNCRRELVIAALAREEGSITQAATKWLGVSHQAVSAYISRTDLGAYLKKENRTEALPAGPKKPYKASESAVTKGKPS